MPVKICFCDNYFFMLSLKIFLLKIHNSIEIRIFGDDHDIRSNFLYGPVKIATIDNTSDIDTYILTGNVKKQCFCSQISKADVNIQDDIKLSCHEN